MPADLGLMYSVLVHIFEVLILMEIMGHIIVLMLNVVAPHYYAPHYYKD